MADPVTPNIGLAQPTRGSDTGVWDTPMNGNTTLIDLICGGTATIGLNNSNVILSAAQFECGRIVFNSTLTGSVAITFPTSFTKSYTILNQCTGSSQFTITMQTTVSGGQAIGCPPGQSFECWNDGTNMTYHNFGPPIGGYWDHAGSSVPNWVPACTVAPYLNCDGTTFSSATYPVLANYLGGNTLPDLRGRYRAYLNQGTGRILSSAAGGAVSSPDGNTLLSNGGTLNIAISASNVPQLTLGATVTLSLNQLVMENTGGAGLGTGGSQFTNITPTVTLPSTLTVNTGSANAPLTNIPPTVMGGITMIRAG